MNKKHGFTLIELLIVISIISIITLITVPNYINYVNYAKKEEAINTGRQIYLDVLDFKFNEEDIEGKLGKIENYINEDLGLLVKCKKSIAYGEDNLICVSYKLNNKNYECQMNIEKNKYEIYGYEKEKKSLYRSY